MEKELLNLILRWFIVSGTQLPPIDCIDDKFTQLNDNGYCDIHGRFNLADLAYHINTAIREALEGATR